MKIGLLVCDEVKPQYRSEFGDYPNMFQALYPNYEFELFFVFKDNFLQMSMPVKDIWQRGLLIRFMKICLG